MTINDLYIRTKDDLEEAVEGLGFLPFFTNSIPGFSIEEHVSEECWFTDGPGVWEWKGPVIRGTSCAYGKFFEKKACYVSAEWFPDLANYRRDGYDMDARFEDEKASWREMRLYSLIEENGPLLSKELKRIGGYGGKEGEKGFDTLIARLQAMGYVVISDFVYATDRLGRPYGWGTAQYATAERQLGERFREAVYRREPRESRERVLERLAGIVPGADRRALERFLG